MKLIAVDIGNSSINIGYFINEGIFVQKFDTKPIKSEPEYASIIGKFLSENHIEKNGFNVIISSVVEGHTSVLKNALKEILGKEDVGILIVNHKINTGFNIKVKNPGELGADRIANAAGALELYNLPVAVLDFGTASTITAIDGNANLIGGAILPGPFLMNSVLESGTSKLKKVPLSPPASALGRDTEGCVSSGIFYGTAGAVERIIEEIENETGCRFNVVITGGFGHIMDKFIRRPHIFNSNLTLEGLKSLYVKNKPS
jgi:type III pantothenate kinase